MSSIQVFHIFQNTYYYMSLVQRLDEIHKDSIVKHPAVQKETESGSTKSEQQHRIH